MDFSTQPLVETEWLVAHLDDPDLRIVDLRWRGNGSGRQRYLRGHIPGAVHLDWHIDLNGDSADDLLLPPDRLAALLGASGIGRDTRVVAYAETDHSGAARLWWALRYHGHAQVAVLNGGISRWRAQSLPLSVDVTVPTPATFIPQVQSHWLATTSEVEAQVAHPQANVRLVDTRPPEQYAGRAVWTPFGSRYLPPGQDWVMVGDRPLRAGHIPGAVHLHASRNLAANWTYHQPEALRALAQAAGIEPNQRVILYCGVGISASLGLFALHLAGYPDLALYDGSWIEWDQGHVRPLEREP